MLGAFHGLNPAPSAGQALNNFIRLVKRHFGHALATRGGHHTHASNSPLAQGFQQLLDHDADDVENAFGLCMQVNYEEFGQTRTYDLLPDGGDIPVTGANRGEYVRLYAKYLLEDSIARQFTAFQRGFHTVCGGECLQVRPPRWPHLPRVPTRRLTPPW